MVLVKWIKGLDYSKSVANKQCTFTLKCLNPLGIDLMIE